MITKIEKLTRLFCIIIAFDCAVMMFQDMLKDKFSLEYFFYGVMCIILFGYLGPKIINRDTFNKLFRGYKVPPIPYLMYLLFYFCSSGTFAIMLTLTITGISPR